jgi:subtilisin family serine protease
MVAGLAGVLMAAFTLPASAAQDSGEILNAGGATALADSYIVVLDDSAVSAAGVGATAARVGGRYGGTVQRTYQHSLNGFEVRMTEREARRLAADSAVRYVEQNHTVHATGTQSPTPSWGIDRIDQRNLPLDDSYTFPNGGSGVTAYIIDTGVRFSHQDFGGRAVSGRDAVDNDNDASDCNGHGTHVAGTVGGSSFGVAKEVRLVGVRVLNCSGSGTLAGVIAGIDWVTGDHAAGAPAVANMSLGGGFNQSLNDAVARSIADGVTYAVAAGNDFGANACNGSPGSTAAAMTVGASEDNDARAPYSNIGTCLDIFAPGTDITSAWSTGDTATNTISGTSMATPHVAGAAALVLAANPGFTPQQVRDKLVGDATTGAVGNPGTGSPNLLLFVGNISAPTQDFSIGLSPDSGSVDPGGSLTTTVSTATTVGEPQPVELSASGAPPEVSVSFSPATVTSGGSVTATISTTPAARPGTYRIAVTGSGTATRQVATFTLTVNGAAGCGQTNDTDAPIQDFATVESQITVSACAGNASATSRLEVHVVHTYRGDLVVTLIAPDGTQYPLLNRVGGSADNVDQTFNLDLSSEPANGTWTLRIRDAALFDTGTLNSWTLNL